MNFPTRLIGAGCLVAASLNLAQAQPNQAKIQDFLKKTIQASRNFVLIVNKVNSGEYTAAAGAEKMKELNEKLYRLNLSLHKYSDHERKILAAYLHQEKIVTIRKQLKAEILASWGELNKSNCKNSEQLRKECEEFLDKTGITK